MRNVVNTLALSYSQSLLPTADFTSSAEKPRQKNPYKKSAEKEKRQFMKSILQDGKTRIENLTNLSLRRLKFMPTNHPKNVVQEFHLRISEMLPVHAPSLNLLGYITSFFTIKNHSDSKLRYVYVHCARIYRASFRENWVDKFGHWSRTMYILPILCMLLMCYQTRLDYSQAIKKPSAGPSQLYFPDHSMLGRPS